jgi:SAM-dependent methyltransferase
MRWRRKELRARSSDAACRGNSRHPSATIRPSTLRRQSLKQAAKRASAAVARRALPLGARRQLAVLAGRQSWLPGQHWWPHAILDDWRARDPNAFHRFLWSHHLAYAESYGTHRFDRESLNLTRQLLVESLVANLARSGRLQEVRSILDVGSSLGYLLRMMEVDVFPGADVFDGVDIDGQAVVAGSHYLRASGSRVRLMHGDMAELDRLVGDTTYDLVVCAGTLMYLDQHAAAEVVRGLIRRTRIVVAMADLAHPEIDNAFLERSGVRSSDGAFIHNLDAMVEHVGARVVWRRWDGARLLDGNSVYFVFAEPQDPRSAAPV